MSPPPSRDTVEQYAHKGASFLLRQLTLAPEQVRARSLRRQAQGTATPGARVLVLSFRDWAVHVQWEAMVAQALRLRGCDVSFLTCGGDLEICDRTTTWEAPPMPCATCQRYVHGSIDAHGFARRSLAEFRVDDDGWPELDEISVGDLRSVESDGLPLGELVHIPAHWFLLSASTEGDPLAPVTLRRFLRSARVVARAMDKALEAHTPDVVLLLNGLFFFESIALELCARRGIDVATYERGMIRDTIFLRRNALALFGDVAHVWDDWRAVPLSDDEALELDRYLLDRQTGHRSIDTYWDDAVDAVPAPPGDGPLAVLFTNLTWDSAVLGRELAFARLQDWLDATIAWFRTHPEARLIVRIHPAEQKLAGRTTREPMSSYLADTHADLPANVRVVEPDDPTHSYSLMRAADVGLVFASTTGLEMALAGKPVVVAAETHYRGKGFTTDIDDAEGYADALDRIMADPKAAPVDIELARRYAYLFFFREPIASPGVEEHVLGLARITTRDLGELAPGANRDVDRICSIILGEEGPR